MSRVEQIFSAKRKSVKPSKIVGKPENSGGSFTYTMISNTKREMPMLTASSISSIKGGSGTISSSTVLNNANVKSRSAFFIIRASGNVPGAVVGAAEGGTNGAAM